MSAKLFVKKDTMENDKPFFSWRSDDLLVSEKDGLFEMIYETEFWGEVDRLKPIEILKKLKELNAEGDKVAEKAVAKVPGKSVKAEKTFTKNTDEETDDADTKEPFRKMISERIAAEDAQKEQLMENLRTEFKGEDSYTSENGVPDFSGPPTSGPPTFLDTMTNDELRTFIKNNGGKNPHHNAKLETLLEVARSITEKG